MLDGSSVALCKRQGCHSQSKPWFFLSFSKPGSRMAQQIGHVARSTRQHLVELVLKSAA